MTCAAPRRKNTAPWSTYDSLLILERAMCYSSIYLVDTPLFFVDHIAHIDHFDGLCSVLHMILVALKVLDSENLLVTVA